MNSDQLNNAADALVDFAAHGCCKNEAWRGRLCSYHAGYEDGIAEFIDDLLASGAVTE